MVVKIEQINGWWMGFNFRQVNSDICACCWVNNEDIYVCTWQLFTTVYRGSFEQIKKLMRLLNDGGVVMKFHEYINNYVISLLCRCSSLMPHDWITAAYNDICGTPVPGNNLNLIGHAGLRRDMLPPTLLSKPPSPPLFSVLCDVPSMLPQRHFRNIVNLQLLSMENLPQVGSFIYVWGRRKWLKQVGGESFAGDHHQCWKRIFTIILIIVK